jgi:hypothetical protein
MTQWTEFLKEKSKETGISYMCLLSDKTIQAEYKKIKKPSEPKKKPKKKTGLDIDIYYIKDSDPKLWNKDINLIKFLLNNREEGEEIEIINQIKYPRHNVISPSDLFITKKDKGLFNNLTENNSLRDIHYVFKEIIETEGEKSKDYDKEEEDKYIKMLNRTHRFSKKKDEKKHDEKKRMSNILKTIISYLWNEETYLIRLLFENSKKYKHFTEKIKKLIKKDAVISPSSLFITKEDKSLLNTLFDYNTEKQVYDFFVNIIRQYDGKIADFKEEYEKFNKLKKSIN